MINIKEAELKILIDLFAGAGGLSYGFKLAGFNVELAIELENNYCKTYEINHPDSVVLSDNIRNLNPTLTVKALLNEIKIKGIIGGPPCMGFSTVGNRQLDDPRNSLIFEFIKWVKMLKPYFFLMENVNGILSMAGGSIIEEIQEAYKKINYSCVVKKLLAADFGVPQLRERIFFIGLNKNLHQDKIDFKGSNCSYFKDFYKKKKDNTSEFNYNYYTVRDAISDILNISPIVNYRKRNENITLEYPNPSQNEYQDYLRKKSKKIQDHIAPNHSKKVKERISQISQGENHSSLPEKFKIRGGYPNIYGRLDLDNPADTITGNCGCVSAPGRFIHPTQNRAISVREAARFQSFPDHYRFIGSMKEKYKQIGNAVPPLLAYAIAEKIKKIIS
ncbi:MAG: DNA (cytosine-5-)-methyltransferase [Candidatus Lokiarchaeota archaeon]|nr:DNA (cytosine-5-)-methyltransferase [Candidatus Lokiarchaeota archaeon]